MPVRIASLILVLSGLNAAQAGILCGHGGCKPQNCYSSVRYVCCPKYETVKIERSCWELKSEAICVPKVRLPWQSCCTPRCARVICVNRLNLRTYECGERCVLVWEVKEVPCRCGKPAVAQPPSPATPVEPPAEAGPAAPVEEPAAEPAPSGLPPAPPSAQFLPESQFFTTTLLEG